MEKILETILKKIDTLATRDELLGTIADIKTDIKNGLAQTDQQVAAVGVKIEQEIESLAIMTQGQFKIIGSAIAENTMAVKANSEDIDGMKSVIGENTVEIAKFTKRVARTENIAVNHEERIKKLEE